MPERQLASCENGLRYPNTRKDSSMDDAHRITEVIVLTKSTEPLTGIVKMRTADSGNEIRDNRRPGAQNLHRSRALSHSIRV